MWAAIKAWPSNNPRKFAAIWSGITGATVQWNLLSLALSAI